MIIKNHALVRIQERCSLTALQIKQIVDKNQYWPIGIKDGHHHKLFYSIPDDECFILVNDQKTNTLITILPLNYHHAWHIDDSALTLAKKAILGHNYKEYQKEIPAALSLGSVFTHRKCDGSVGSCHGRLGATPLGINGCGGRVVIGAFPPDIQHRLGWEHNIQASLG